MPVAVVAVDGGDAPSDSPVEGDDEAVVVVCQPLIVQSEWPLGASFPLFVDRHAVHLCSALVAVGTPQSDTLTLPVSQSASNHQFDAVAAAHVFDVLSRHGHLIETGLAQSCFHVRFLQVECCFDCSPFLPSYSSVG